MIISTVKTMTTENTIDDITSMITISVLAKELQDSLNENEIIVSTTTGECIEWHDLARLRGVLDALLSNTDWKIEKR